MLFFLFLITIANGQETAYCADHGEGACLGLLCPDGATCINDYGNVFCCDNDKIILFDCCADGGIGGKKSNLQNSLCLYCLGNFCPVGAECIYDGRSTFCCAYSEIIRNCTGKILSTAPLLSQSLSFPACLKELASLRHSSIHL